MQTKRELHRLFAISAVAVIVPALILSISIILLRLNDAVGYPRYGLPVFVLRLYMSMIVLAPAVGLWAIGKVWVRRAHYAATDLESKRRGLTLITAMLAILLDALWVVYFGYVFFAAGGTR